MRTQREFFAALAKCRNGWKIEGATWIRHASHCPITAVVEAETGETFYAAEYPKAAVAIGLPAKLAARLAMAADTRVAEPRLRERILAALGLAEATR